MNVFTGPKFRGGLNDNAMRYLNIDLRKPPILYIWIEHRNGVGTIPVERTPDLKSDAHFKKTLIYCHDSNVDLGSELFTIYKLAEWLSGYANIFAFEYPGYADGNSSTEQNIIEAMRSCVIHLNNAGISTNSISLMGVGHGCIPAIRSANFDRFHSTILVPLDDIRKVAKHGDIVKNTDLLTSPSSPFFLPTLIIDGCGYTSTWFDWAIECVSGVKLTRGCISRNSLAVVGEKVLAMIKL